MKHPRAGRTNPNHVRCKNRQPGSKLYYRPALSGGKWSQFVRYHATGSILQVCCGASRIGLARLDIDAAAPAANVRGDMLALPFKDKSFETVACDPMYELDHKLRVKLQREVFRVARRRVIFKAPWIPRGFGWYLTETVLVASHTCSNVAVLSLLRCDLPAAPLLPVRS
jgi:hypothetical protein